MIDFYNCNPRLFLLILATAIVERDMTLAQKWRSFKRPLEIVIALDLCHYQTFDDPDQSLHQLHQTPVSFSDPIWILFSSGTTGKPKAIVHGTGAMILEHQKALAIHQNVCEGDRYFWYSTTGWMMWNYALSSLLCGATLCLYNGAPTTPSLQFFGILPLKQKSIILDMGQCIFSSKQMRVFLGLKAMILIT